jgi:hypothetical protein
MLVVYIVKRPVAIKATSRVALNHLGGRFELESIQYHMSTSAREREVEAGGISMANFNLFGANG